MYFRTGLACVIYLLLAFVVTLSTGASITKSSGDTDFPGPAVDKDGKLINIIGNSNGNGNKGNNGIGSGNSNGNCEGNCGGNILGNGNGNGNKGDANGIENGNCVGNCLANFNGNANGNDNAGEENGSGNGNCVGNCFHNKLGNFNGNGNKGNGQGSGNGNCFGNCFHLTGGNGNGNENDKKDSGQKVCVGNCIPDQPVHKTAIYSPNSDVRQSPLNCSIAGRKYYVRPGSHCLDSFVELGGKVTQWKCTNGLAFDVDICACNHWYFIDVHKTCLSGWSSL